MNLEQARFNMIEQQIRPWEVLDTQVLSLLAMVKRENFVPKIHRELAFADLEIPLPPLDVQAEITAELDALEETKRGLLSASELARRAMRVTLDARLGGVSGVPAGEVADWHVVPARMWRRPRARGKGLLVNLRACRVANCREFAQANAAVCLPVVELRQRRRHCMVWVGQQYS